MFAECCDYLGSIIESAWDIFKNATFNYGDVTISFHGVFVFLFILAIVCGFIGIILKV